MCIPELGQILPVPCVALNLYLLVSSSASVIAELSNKGKNKYLRLAERFVERWLQVVGVTGGCEIDGCTGARQASVRRESQLFIYQTLCHQIRRITAV